MADAIEFLFPPFMMCVVLAGIHVYMGMHVLKREVIFVDLALAQMAALGSTVAMYMASSDHGRSHALGDTHGHSHEHGLGILDDEALMSFAFAALGAVLFALAGRVRKHVSQEAVVGIVYAVSTAAMMLLLSKSPEGAENMKRVFGGILLLTQWEDVTHSALIYVAVGIALFVFRKPFHMLTWEPQEAESQLNKPALWDLVFYLLFAVVLTVSIKSAGVLLVFSFLIVPAVITRLFWESITGRLLLGWLLAICASVFGLALSWNGDFPAGASIIMIFGILLVLAGLTRWMWRQKFTQKTQSKESP